MLSHRGSIWEKTILVDDMITQREMALAQGCQIKVINLSQVVEEKRPNDIYCWLYALAKYGAIFTISHAIAIAMLGKEENQWKSYKLVFRPINVLILFLSNILGSNIPERKVRRKRRWISPTSVMKFHNLNHNLTMHPVCMSPLSYKSSLCETHGIVLLLWRKSYDLS